MFCMFVLFVSLRYCPCRVCAQLNTVGAEADWLEISGKPSERHMGKYFD